MRASVAKSSMRAESAYDQLFRDEYASIVRSAYLVTGDLGRAQEVAQEAFTQLFVHWRKISGYERPGAWLRKVAVRAAVRSERRARLGGQLAVALVAPDSAEPVWDDGPDGRLELALRSLPAAQRAAVVLRYYDDLDIADVARALGCTEATARVHLHRARQRLGQLLGEVTDDAAR